MIGIDEAKDAARNYAARPKEPGDGYAKCAVCQENAGHHVRVLGSLVPFCREDLPPHTKDEFGTHLLDEDGK
ncbi:hypothetical protein [Rhodococcus qingshengii]|uniref:hypothetical protein n=1 Tax=Rhodococcus qingshengii TaxID=334542 RepID=UPI001A41D934|nr:hypothetical protein [Rhodococcus qingshengii]ULD38897.1 hypothetical protein JKI97_00965 [Rhodococcus qingshengii]